MSAESGIILADRARPGDLRLRDISTQTVDVDLTKRTDSDFQFREVGRSVRFLSDTPATSPVDASVVTTVELSVIE